MLIKPELVIETLKTLGIPLNGVLHIGSHECEELKYYTSWGIKAEDVIWVDAIEDNIEKTRRQGIPNLYQAVVSDKDDEIVTFNISNNVQSSSILELGTHAASYPHIEFVKKLELPTITIDTFLAKHNLNPENYTFWNFDIQGAELKALKGATNSLKHARVLFLEVNTREVYKGCALKSEIDAFLKPYGFEEICSEMIEEHGWGDAMYVRL